MNPNDWPNVDLKPSKVSVKGQRYVGFGGEKIDNLGELTVRVRTEITRWRRHFKPNDIPRGPRSASPRLQCQVWLTKVTSLFSMEAGPPYCQARVQVWPLYERPSQGFKDVFHCTRKKEYSSCGRGNLRVGRRRISVGGELLERAEYQAQKAWTTRNTVERKRIGYIW